MGHSCRRYPAPPLRIDWLVWDSDAASDSGNRFENHWPHFVSNIWSWIRSYVRSEDDGDDANDLALSNSSPSHSASVCLSLTCSFSDCQLSVRDLIAAISESSKKSVSLQLRLNCMFCGCNQSFIIIELLLAVCPSPSSFAPSSRSSHSSLPAPDHTQLYLCLCLIPMESGKRPIIWLSWLELNSATDPRGQTWRETERERKRGRHQETPH